MAGTGGSLLCQPSPAVPLHTLVWGGWRGAELLCGQGWGALGPQTQPSHGTSLALSILSCAISVHFTPGTGSLCCGVPAVQQEKAAGHLLYPIHCWEASVPFWQRLCPTMVASPVLRVLSLPGALLLPQKALSPLWCLLTWLSPWTSTSPPISQQANHALLLAETVFKGSFPPTFRNILVHIDFVELKCFVFLQLL